MNKVKSIKSKNDIEFGIGAGYNYLDNVRLDLTFDHLVNPKFKSKIFLLHSRYGQIAN